MKIGKVKPVIPRDAADPANQRSNLSRAIRELKKRFKTIEKEMVSLVYDQTQYRTEISANAWWRPLIYYTNMKGELDVIKGSRRQTNKAYYEYQIDTARYQQIDNFIERLLYRNLLESITGERQSRWFYQSYLEFGYNRGLADAVQSIKNQVPPEIVEPEIVQLVRGLDPEAISLQQTQALGLIYARVFNNMKGLTDEMKVNLSETLTRGMADGLGVREISADIKKRVGVGFSRAQRIARTEILQSYRTAQRARTREINNNVFDDSPYVFRQLWFSALADTSRPNHVAKHGRIYTQQEVERFYSEPGFAPNCLCSQSPVLVERKTGEPVNKDLIKNMIKQKERWRG